MSFFKNKTILIISTEAWSHIAVSKHHYAITLAGLGARVFFLNPPAKQNKVTQQESAANLFIVDYSAIRGTNSLPSFLRNLVNATVIRKIKWHIGKIDVVWSFDPYRFQNLNLFNASLKVYHPVDRHNFKLEKEILKTSDLILTVSDLILKKYRASKSFKVPHGLPQHFLNHVNPIINKKVKMVGYVGNLESTSVDFATLMQIVEQHIDLQFTFIGPYKTSSRSENLLKKSNCRLLGQVLSDTLPQHFSSIDIFLICYDGKMKVNNSNNHKVLEFLSTGKPVVMNFTDEYKDKKELVAMTEKNDELPLIFKNVVDDYSKYIEPELVKKRIAFAQSNTYAAHVERIASLAQQVKRELS